MKLDTPSGKTKTRDWFMKYRWALLSGVLMGTSYIPFPPWALFFCFIPLYLDIVIRCETPWEAFKRAWVCQAVFTLIGFYWISYVAHVFGFLPWPVAIVVLLLFAAGMHLHVPIAMALGQFLKKRFDLSAGATLLLLGLLMAFADQTWPGMFPFHLGYTWLWIRSPVSQWADVIGFLGLGLLVHLAQGGIAGAMLAQNRLRQTITLITLVAVFGALHFTGFARKQNWEGADQQLRVLLVQANIGNIEKLFAEKGRGFQKDIANKYFSLTSEALQGEAHAGNPPIDLVIWPESAFPDALDAHNGYRTYTSQFLEFQSSSSVAILTGSYSNSAPHEKPRKEFNALFLYEKDKGLENPPYRKTHLLAFGEFVPFGDTFPILKKWNPGGEGFARGDGPMTLDWRGIKIGPQICYESLYPEFSSALLHQGADILVNLTNDSWFGPTSEPYQHLFMTLARAIEVRRPLLRSTNTGISTVIDAAGNIQEQSPMFKEWTGVYNVPLRKSQQPTIYSKWGHWLPLLTGILILLTLAWGARKPKA